jgi:hypothetical protein
MHKTLRQWRARRAGGRITVYGECNTTRTPTKITNVDTITTSSAGHVVAIDKDNVTHYLLQA